MVQVFLEVHHVLWLQSPDTLSLFALVVPTERIRFLVEQSLSCFRSTALCSHFPVTLPAKAPISPDHTYKSPRPLVLVCSTALTASTPSLSNSSSPSGLTSFRYGGSHLEVSFPLRCFQRLSAPEIATRLCRWHDNRHTSAPSTPVLSY